MADRTGKAAAGGSRNVGHSGSGPTHSNASRDNSHVVDMEQGSSRQHQSLGESFANSPLEPHAKSHDQANGDVDNGSDHTKVFPCMILNKLWKSRSGHLLLRQLVAEAIGTFILVFGGCGSAIVKKKVATGVTGEVDHLGVSIAFGVVVMIMIYAVGHISGAHINPAVTVAFAAVRHFPKHIVPLYIGAQIAGAICSAGVLRLILGIEADRTLGATLPSGSDWQSFGMEIMITYILMFVVLSVATDTRAIGDMAGIAIGSTVGLNAIYAGPISGASMNPARSIGPAVVANNYRALWVYIFGPGLGALLGAWSYNIIKGSAPTPAELETRATKNVA